MSTPSTRAVLALRAAGVDFTIHEYRYTPRGGTRVSSSALALPEHAIVKTLVMEDQDGDPLIVLMHGDREVSTQKLARQAGSRRVEPCAPDTASRHTGYLVGGTSPFGTRKRLPVYMERSILDLDKVYVNGGRRGLLVGLEPAALVHLLTPTLVDVAI